jgi:iron complex transport system substrate-binding protein
MPSRRAFLALGAAAFFGRGADAATMPQRIVSLEWTATEMLLTLGLAPAGAGDVGDYRNWVVEPRLPLDVLDLGSRFEPNREVIHGLQPDLVVVTSGYGFAVADWENLAPVHEVHPIAPPGVDAVAHAQAELGRLAERTGRLAEAENFLSRSSRSFGTAAALLAKRPIDPVCVVSMFEERSARIYGTGVLDAVMRRLGVTNAWTGDVGPWGFATAGLEELALLPPSTQLIILDPIPDPVRIRLEHSSLWPNLPVVRAGRVRRIAPVWPFGGPVSAVRFARLLSTALLGG